MQDPDKEVALLEPLLDGVAQHLLDLGSHVERRAHLVESVDVDDERQGLDEAMEVELGDVGAYLIHSPASLVLGYGGAGGRPMPRAMDAAERKEILNRYVEHSPRFEQVAQPSLGATTLVDARAG